MLSHTWEESQPHLCTEVTLKVGGFIHRMSSFNGLGLGYNQGQQRKLLGLTTLQDMATK